MRVRNLSVLPIAALALMFVAPASEMRADVIFSNFGPGNTYQGNSWVDVGNGTLFGMPPGSPNQVVAFSFTPTVTAMLTGADLALASNGGAATPLNVFIESNASGVPGTILDTLTQPASETIPIYPTTAVINFDCTGSCTTLNAGTTYWIVGQQSDASNLSIWFWSFSDTGIGAFNNVNSVTGPWTSQSAVSTFAAFDVTGTPTGAVPEPASLALLGSGLLGVVAAMRRRAWKS